MTTSTEPRTQYAVEGGIATIAFDSPHNRNALSRQLVTEFGLHLQAAAADTDVRAIVVTHTGTTFCSGADLTEAPTATTADRAGLLGLLRQIVELPKPVVARIDGNVRAGGLGVIGACDVVIAGPSSTFSFTESKLGLAPVVISLVTLTRMTDRACGRYFLSAEVFDAAEALRTGLVTIVDEDVVARTEALLDHFRAASPQGLAESKLLTTAHVRRMFDEQSEEMITTADRLFTSEEVREGVTAFFERRPPRWAITSNA